jgi:hypothetical protein
MLEVFRIGSIFVCNVMMIMFESVRNYVCLPSRRSFCVGLALSLSLSRSLVPIHTSSKPGIWNTNGSNEITRAM